ncbi:MAG TPA: hypothetical protein VFW92_10455, partial [Candidatus Limnocylindrales bacterium]|nr:hypothetical protein [Candidatus Limnocylindrales bacterium]
MLALAETIGWSDPLTPAEKPFSLFIGENDLTAYVDRDSYDLEDPGGTQPATLAVVLTDVQNLVGLGVTQRSRMRWMDNVHDRTLFDGFVKLIEPNGVANYAEWQVTASHVEAVLDGLFIPSAARPAEDTDVRMQALLASCLPAAAPLAFGAGGHLGVTGGQDEATYANQTLRAVLESVLAGGTAKATGYFIDPQDWSLHTYEGTDSGLAAPYEISDAETAGRSYRDTLMNLGPLAYWRLGETSGTVMRDETGNYPGTYGTADTLDQAGLLPNDPSSSILVTSSVGHGHIDGVASSASQMSISLVVGIGIHAGSDMLVSRNWNNGAGAWLVYLSFAGFPAFYVNVDGTATKNVTAPTIAGPGTHH